MACCSRLKDLREDNDCTQKATEVSVAFCVKLNVGARPYAIDLTSCQNENFSIFV